MLWHDVPLFVGKKQLQVKPQHDATEVDIEISHS
jgi:hypothetical protein